MKVMKALCTGLALFACVHFGLGATTTAMPSNTNIPHMPSVAALDKLVDASFKNVDSDKDGFIEAYEFDTLIIVADNDDDGCMTLDEYKHFSAGTPEIASKIYTYFDTDNSNCLTVDKVFSQFALMDTDKNQKVTPQEFETYYVNLLKMLFGKQGQTVG